MMAQKTKIVKATWQMASGRMLMGEVNALSNPGNLHCPVMCWIFRHLVAADGEVAQQVEW